MNAAFDTLQYAKRAEKAGFTKQQAECLAEETAKLVDNELVTKTYLSNELQLLENRLIIKLGGFIIIWTTIALTVLGFIIKT